MKKVLSFVLALCMICTLLPATTFTANAADGEYVKTDLADIKSTDIVVITMTKDSTTWALYNGNGTSKAPTATVVTVSGDKITSDVTDDLKWNISNSDGTLTIYPNGTTTSWLYCTSSNNGVRVGTNANKAFTIDATSGYLKNTATNRYLGVYTSNPDWRCYTNTTGNTAGQTLAFYVLSQGGSSEPVDPDCQHTTTETVTGKAATCTETGLTDGEKCTACGVWVVEQETIAAKGHTLVHDAGKDATCTEPGLTAGNKCTECSYTEQTVIPAGHNYVDGTCTGCGAAEPNEVEATITFDADKTQRTEYSTSMQVWENAGVSFTNNKASSTNNVGDYGNPVRLYAKSTVIVESSLGNISKIVFDCNSGTYATTLQTSIGTVSGATVTVSSDKVTVQFTEPVESFTVTLTAQVRMDSLTVTSVKAGDASCPHTNKETLPAQAPTCTEDGLKEGWVCTECGFEEQEVDPKTGHDLVDGEAKEATCTEAGLTAGKYCTQCDYTEQEVIPAGHNYVNGVCSGCGQELPNEATITFDDTSKRIEFAANQQVWLENGVTVKNEKNTSTNDMGNYSEPVRFYKNSNLTITYAAIGQIIIDCNNGTYANAMKNSIAADGTVTVYSDKVVFVPATPAESFTFTMSAAVWIDSITVICNAAEVDGVLYTSLEAALENTTGTLKLLADQTVNTLDVPETSDLVIDLNGKTLTATSIVATVTDTADGTGLVKVANDGATLKSVTGQMILWDNTGDASGYRVFSYTFTNMGMDANMNEGKDDTSVSEQYNTTVKSFWSDLTFTNKKAYTLVASAFSGLKVSFKLSIGDTSKTFTFDAAVLKDWATDEESNLNDTKNYCFYISVYGFDNLEEGYELTVTPVISFAGNNTVTADPTVYTEA